MSERPRIREDLIDPKDPQKPGSPGNPIELGDEDILSAKPITPPPQERNSPATRPLQTQFVENLMDQLGSRDIDPSVFFGVVRDRLREVGPINHAASDDHILDFREGGGQTGSTGPTSEEMTVMDVAKLESNATRRIMAANRAARDAAKTLKQRTAGRRIRKALEALNS